MAISQQRKTPRATPRVTGHGPQQCGGLDVIRGAEVSEKFGLLSDGDGDGNGNGGGGNDVPTLLA